MPSFLSPGVYTREVDLSLYIPNLATTAIGMVGLASKGPINEPIFISNAVQFNQIFGDTNPDYMGPYAALQYLGMGRQLWYVRVAEPNTDENTNVAHPYLAVPATLPLSETYTPAKVIGNKASVATISSGVNTLIFAVDGTPAVVTVDLYGSASATFQMSLSEIAAVLNANATFVTYCRASVSPAGYLTVERLLGGSLRSVAVSGTAAAQAFGTATLTATGTGNAIVPASINGIGSAVSWPVNIVTASNDTLIFNMKKGATPPGGVAISPITITLAANAALSRDNAINALNQNATFRTEFIALPWGTQLKIAAINSPVNSFAVTGTAKSTLFGNSPNETQTYSEANAVSCTFTAVTPGTWGNNISVAVQNVTATTFDVLVYEKSYLVERYEKLVKTPVTVVDPADNTKMIDNPKYLETAINGVSTRVTVANAIGGGANLIPAATVAAAKFTGGTNGESGTGVVNPSIYIGVEDANGSTGLQIFRNPEKMDINIIAVPGISDAGTIQAMIDLCIYRQDCMCLVDPPFGLLPQEVVDWRNGARTYAADHATFNSSYAALYWPWLEVYDPTNKQRVWTAPSGHAAYVYAFTDFSSEAWTPPAGLLRGKLNSALRAEYVPSLGERDLLYSNNINPIATFIKYGINIYGQKTLQSLSTALDRVNVRRLLLILRKVVATASLYYNFQPNNEVTWIQFVHTVKPYMESVKSRQGVTNFEVRCDATTNTSDSIDRNEMHALIFIQPTKAAEFIQIDFVITPTGVNFSEISY